MIPIVLFSLVGLVLHACYSQWRRRKYLANYPWVGTEDKLWFPRLRARIHNVANFKTVIKDAYQKYSLQDQTFVLPTSADDLIILPPSHMEWIINQPDHFLSSVHPHVDSLQSDYTFPHPRVIRNPVHHQVIKRDLVQQLGNLTDDIVDEIEHATGLFWPKDDQTFQPVHVFGTMMRIVARTSNRIFVGTPLCRDQDYLNSAAGFAREVPTQAATLKQLPSLLRPLVSRFTLSRNRKHISTFTSLVIPEIEKRQAALTDAEKASKYTPNDALQWLINQVEGITGRVGALEREPLMIANRLMALNFAAIHTSTFTITNAIFDLISTDPSQSYLSQLCEEIETVLGQDDNRWTKPGLARMHKLDSALRESLRLGSFLGPGMTRTVKLREGLTTPNGTFCPYGSKVAVASTGIHNDATHYPPDPSAYDPFRFSKQRATADVSIPVRETEDGNGETANAADENADYVKRANLAFVSTSMAYHPFGHGKHCCPGRFFAANELKLLLAHLLLNYDFEMMGERPKSFWRGLVYVPPMESCIRVRRRFRAPAYGDGEKTVSM